ncbi:MAG: hypothetical protein GF419_14200 [Ignavibacteriales bacterium]|nr:hypothetical protein [Ignavibacteriales bacterium]
MAEKFYYYRIFDDQQEKNYFKSSLEEEEIRDLLKQFEKDNHTYLNAEFVEFLKERDPNAEVIEIRRVYY